MIYLGVDPGASGAIAAIDSSGAYVGCMKLKETDHDVSTWLMCFDGLETKAMIELVSAMPKQGVSSTFKFGNSAGFVRGLIVAHRIPYQFVTPAKWQGAMKCRSKGDKNVTKAAAQRLWPDLKITHATADALLLARYALETDLTLRKEEN